MSKFFSFFVSVDITLCYALVAQSVERVLGKDEVTGSIPVEGSRKKFF